MAPSSQGQSAIDGPLLLRRLPVAHLVRLLGDWRGGGSAYPALAAALRTLVIEGRLPPHTRIPSERALAAALGVSRNTATAALDLLRAEGYLASRRGTGSWTTAPPAASGRPDETAPPAGDLVDLTVANLPAPAGLGDLAATAAETLRAELSGHGYMPLGLPAARVAIAAHLTARGLATEPAQVLVTQGAMHAWDLILRTLAVPGDRVLVESPTYPGALDAVRAHRCVPVPVPVTEAGWDVPLLLAALRDARPKLAYLIPDFQNPTGALAGAAEREAVARAARAAGTLLVTDESLVELRLDPGPPPPSLAAGDPGTGVLATGSLSKLVWGGLRTGWIRAGRDLVQRLALARGGQDIAGPVLDQLLAVEAIGRLEEIVLNRRALLAERRDALFAALAADLPGWDVPRPAGGMSAWARLPDGVPASALAARAPEHGVRVAAGARFDAGGGFEQRLRLPFTQPPERLAAAVRGLAAAQAGLGLPAARSAQAPRWVA